MSARVEVDDVIATSDQFAHRAAPRVPCLATAVKQNNGRSGRITADVGSELDAAGPVEALNADFR
jgi:hypothetical protein